METESAVASAFVAGFRPEPDITVSEWADKYRIVGKPSPEPGPWRTSRVPYAKDIMDRLSPCDPCEIVVLMKAAQGAGSEIGHNALGCWMHRYPDSIIVVQPTVDTAKKFSRIRFDRFVGATPVLRGLIPEKVSRAASNSYNLKEYGPARDSLVITGGNSAVGLRSYPSRYALADEIDGYELDIEGEGSPIDLLIQRTAAFRNRKIFMVSTPTLAGFSAIEKWYNAGDQNQYLMPCPLCGHMQPLIWGADRASTGALGGLRWPKGSPDLARYQCEQCGDLFEEWRKVEALNRAGWEPMAAGNGRGKIRSYGINALYYPYGWPGNTWTQLAAEWERVHRDPIGLKTFVNTKLGQPWKDPTEAKLDADILLARRESFGESLPAGVAVLTFGADVQINRIEAELIGWGANEESWSIEYLVFVGDTTKLVSGDPNHPSPWEQLDAWARGEWLSELGIPLSIRAGCIDAGYQGQIVRKFCGERFGRRLWATIGRAGQGHPVWPTRAARKMEKRQQYPPAIVIGVDQAKEIVYARLKIDHPGPGFCHFPVTRDRDYFEMLTAEVCVPDYTGTQPRRVWKKKASGARNESLDARNNGYAAMLGLVSTTGLNLSKEAERIRQMVEAMRNPPPEAPRRESAPSWFGENTKNWFKNR